LAWVWPEPLAELCGGKNLEERRAALRACTEGAVRQGGAEPPWNRVVDGLALGSAAFAEQVRHEARGNAREQRALRGLVKAPAWAQIVEVLEHARGRAGEAL